MSAAEVLNPHALIPCRNSVWKQVWKPNDRERNAGLMESFGLHGIRAGETERERQRERDRETERVKH